MATVPNPKEDIINTLIQRAMDGDFYKTIRGATGGLQKVDDANVVSPTLPILCDETQCNFEVDPDHGRSYKMERLGWTFALRMKFNVPVLLDVFCENLVESPPMVPATDGFPNYILKLQSMEVDHPVQQGGATGTIVEFTFEAEEGRR